MLTKLSLCFTKYIYVLYLVCTMFSFHNNVLQATDRAKLGQKAMRLLKRGRPVDDQLTVDIIIEAIRYNLHKVLIILKMNL